MRSMVRTLLWNLHGVGPVFCAWEWEIRVRSIQCGHNSPNCLVDWLPSPKEKGWNVTSPSHWEESKEELDLGENVHGLENTAQCEID